MTTKNRTAYAAHLACAGAVAVVAIVLALAFAATPAHAYTEVYAGNWKSGTYKYVLQNKGSDLLPSFENHIEVFDAAYADKITKVKTNKKSVAGIIHKKKYSFTVVLKKAGKATISYKFKGKIHKVKLVVSKYVNPLKKFKVGGVDYRAKFAKYPTFRAKDKIGKQVLSVKAKKGWKVERIDVGLPTTEKDVKNNTVLPKNTDSVLVCVKNKKSGVEEHILLWDKDVEIEY